MRNLLILRLILAFVFAAFAVNFSQLIPAHLVGDSDLIKVIITLISAVLGFAVFPDIAKRVRLITVTFFNFIVNRVSSEVSNQILRLRGQTPFPVGQINPQVGSLAITRPLILDTSAIIDGRILDIAKAGFISGLLLIPRFVLSELQQVADSKDDLKRQRGRNGFDSVEKLKKIKGVRVEIWDKEQTGKLVDDKLLNLARGLHGKIVTTDYNLNKVAQVANIAVLNVNDLANAVKVIALPGEQLNIKIAHLGKDTTQGVGYLPDGTMVVISDAAKDLGKTLKIEVSKTLQVPAGRMVFGRKV